MTATETRQPTRPEIVENYRDFQPPRRIRKSLDTLLDAVPPKYLVGLQTILLTNQAAITKQGRRKRMWSRNHQVRPAQCSGTYHGTKSSPATITLYIDNILQFEGPWMRLLPLTRYAALGTVLYHELGHHIHTLHRPVCKEKENVADDWSDKLYVDFLRVHYWYLRRFLHPVRLFFDIFGYPKKPTRRS
jgi:hypothetical protein